MALVKCYDPQGNEHQKEPVDAKECVKNCGFTMTPPEAKEEKADPEKSDADAAQKGSKKDSK